MSIEQIVWWVMPAVVAVLVVAVVVLAVVIVKTRRRYVKLYEQVYDIDTDLETAEENIKEHTHKLGEVGMGLIEVREACADFTRRMVKPNVPESTSPIRRQSALPSPYGPRQDHG